MNLNLTVPEIDTLRTVIQAMGGAAMVPHLSSAIGKCVKKLGHKDVVTEDDLDQFVAQQAAEQAQVQSMRRMMSRVKHVLFAMGV